MPTSSFQNLSSRFLKALVDGASTTYCGSRFQSATILWLKNIRRTRLVFLDWDSFRLCPLRSCPVSAIWKIWDESMFSLLVTILYVSIRSPLNRRFSGVVSCKAFSLFSYGLFFKDPTSFVALLWTRSRLSISFFRYGDQIWIQYSKCGRM